MGNTDVVSLRTVEKQPLAKFPLARHRTVNRTMMLANAVQCLATFVVEFPVGDWLWDAGDGLLILGANHRCGKATEASGDTESVPGILRTRYSHVGSLHSFASPFNSSGTLSISSHALGR